MASEAARQEWTYGFLLRVHPPPITCKLVLGVGRWETSSHQVAELASGQPGENPHQPFL